ncbi:MAG: hypothetical protein NT135_01640 [Candidatus Berkelbacteria bacterium]|nr:hypothetical protein [Candidatus Berkelbacteria bacterium]
MNSEEKTEKQKEFQKFLTDENDSINNILNEARDFHYKNLNENLKRFLNFNIKLGELSLIVGAAIGPVIIATNKDISQSIYVFLAIILYLLNGIFAIWKAKDSVEKQLDAYSPSVLHKLESEVYPMQFSIDKLRHEPDNREYLNEFFNNRALIVGNYTEIEIPKRKVDFTLDVLTLIFVLASLLLIRTVWPFSAIYYWIFFALIVATVTALIVKSFLQAKERAIQNERNTKRLNEMKRTHIEWQNQNVFKNEK